MAGMRMPARYVAEMVCDRIAASKNYKGASYTDASAWEYYDRSKDHYLLHPETRRELEECLLICAIKARTPALRISAKTCWASAGEPAASGMTRTPAGAVSADGDGQKDQQSVLPGCTLCTPGGFFCQNFGPGVRFCPAVPSGWAEALPTNKSKEESM